MFRKKLHVDMKFLHVKANMGFFSQHDVGEKSHVNMEHLFLMDSIGSVVLKTLHTHSSTTSNIRLLEYRLYCSWANSQRPPFVLSTKTYKVQGSCWSHHGVRYLPSWPPAVIRIKCKTTQPSFVSAFDALGDAAPST